jgi:hypothetical protein
MANCEVVERVSKGLLEGIREAGGIFCSPAEWDQISDAFKYGVLKTMACRAIDALLKTESEGNGFVMPAATFCGGGSVSELSVALKEE